jgi:hypothetical protein
MSSRFPSYVVTRSSRRRRSPPRAATRNGCPSPHTIRSGTEQIRGTKGDVDQTNLGWRDHVRSSAAVDTWSTLRAYLETGKNFSFLCFSYETHARFLWNSCVPNMPWDGHTGKELQTERIGTGGWKQMDRIWAGHSLGLEGPDPCGYRWMI